MPKSNQMSSRLKEKFKDAPQNNGSAGQAFFHLFFSEVSVINICDGTIIEFVPDKAWTQRVMVSCCGNNGCLLREINPASLPYVLLIMTMLSIFHLMVVPCQQLLREPGRTSTISGISKISSHVDAPYCVHIVLFSLSQPNWTWKVYL